MSGGDGTKAPASEASPVGSPDSRPPSAQTWARCSRCRLGSVPGVSGVTGAALRETCFINRSLAALADVLGALAERRGHVPYQNSKLTHMLQDALGTGVPVTRPCCPVLLRRAGSSCHSLSGDLLALSHWSVLYTLAVCAQD